MDYTELREMASNETWISAGSMLNEATYYGRNDKLLKAEKILDEMCQLGHAGEIGSSKFVDRLMELEKLMADIFGFADFTINSSIVQLQPAVLLQGNSVGACTMVQSCYVKYAKMATPGGIIEVVDFDKNHKGVAFKKNANYKMSMFLGMDLFMDHGEYTLTGAEILGVMLHEIGHNFYYGPVRELTLEALRLLSIRNIVALINAMMMTIMLQIAPREIDSVLKRDYPELHKGMATLGTTSGKFSAPFMQCMRLFVACKNLFMLFGMLAGAVFLNTTMITAKVVIGAFKYDSEKYSDAFAAAYGYGAEVITALQKISHISVPVVSDNKSIQTMIDLIYSMGEFPLLLLYTFTDPHPGTQQRLKNQIKFMEQAASSIKDPKLRKEYTRNIQDMYNTRDQIVKYTGLNSIKATDKFIAMIQDICHIEDPRELYSAMSRGKYKNIDIE